MADPRIAHVADDFVNVQEGPMRSIVWAFGDTVEIRGDAGERVEVRVHNRGQRTVKGSKWPNVEDVEPLARERLRPPEHDAPSGVLSSITDDSVLEDQSCPFLTLGENSRRPHTR